ncbi:DUF3846 domain-containing protein [Pseudarthrobacter sp. ATCC 49987]|uniref:DUF3846 domain-containing protein n=1 Tax=Pseudarthrobacter sp. ATCC 49987 TaxID=2698204 RepID=UPI00136CC167|nr:hypothetical protein [Pseudarthrobacter sp. ATCC 49987]
MSKALLIPADNQLPLEVCDFADIKALEDVLGGTGERFPMNRPDASLFHNESAPYLDLPTNRRATLALWCHATSRRGKQAVVGDSVLLGPLTEQGELQDVPQWYVMLFLETDRFKVHAQRLEDMAWREHERVFDDWEQAYTSVLLHAERNAMISQVRVVPAS